MPLRRMTLWIEMGRAVAGLKEKLLVKQVCLQTKAEFNLAGRLNDYRFIRLGFAAMEQDEAIEIQELYGI